MLSGERAGGGAQGLKFVRQGPKGSARQSRSPVNDRLPVGPGGIPAGQGAQVQAELKGILMNYNYQKDHPSGQRYAAYGPHRSTPVVVDGDDEVLSAKSGPGALGGAALSSLSQQQTQDNYAVGSSQTFENYEHNNNNLSNPTALNARINYGATIPPDFSSHGGRRDSPDLLTQNARPGLERNLTMGRYQDNMNSERVPLHRSEHSRERAQTYMQPRMNNGADMVLASAEGPRGALFGAASDMPRQPTHSASHA